MLKMKEPHAENVTTYEEIEKESIDDKSKLSYFLSSSSGLMDFYGKLMFICSLTSKENSSLIFEELNDRVKF